MTFRPPVVAAAIAAVALAGCSSSSKSGASSADTTTATTATVTTVASAKQPVCAARVSLKQSVAALANPALLAGGKSAIQPVLDTVKTNLAAVSNSAGAVYKPQVDEVDTAVSELETALSKLGNGNTSQDVKDVATAIAKVSSTATTLVTTLQAVCPSS